MRSTRSTSWLNDQTYLFSQASSSRQSRPWGQERTRTTTHGGTEDVRSTSKWKLRSVRYSGVSSFASSQNWQATLRSLRKTLAALVDIWRRTWSVYISRLAQEGELSSIASSASPSSSRSLRLSTCAPPSSSGHTSFSAMERPRKTLSPLRRRSCSSGFSSLPFTPTRPASPSRVMATPVPDSLSMRQRKLGIPRPSRMMELSLWEPMVVGSEALMR
mmetsp:Transcript_48861/g.139911  ORF Transcript_48861/g.139911 Transcript_48861/m.139911 type:complete len:217 (-) Transcript_48861:1377-2027(-)